MKKLTFAIVSAIIFTFIVSAYSEKTEQELADNIIRLHIIADSDSDADQSVKLMVRDRIIKEMSPILSQAQSLDDSKRLILENMGNIQAIADDELRKNGFSYTSQCSLGSSSFPTKVYGDIILPPGDYTALKVTLGSGDGRNWWCVMYPPLCLVDGDTVISEESKNMLKNNLGNDTYDLITQNGDCPDIQVKFKIVEIFQELNS